jgi:asparagine synthase (glutamine-hydrolysing)
LLLDFETFEVDVHNYWKLQVADNIIDDKTAIEKTQALIHNATKEHLLSDVPVGIFLSGGYDSTTLLMHMHDLGYPTKGFTIGFPDSDQSEHLQAAAAAKHFKAEHYIEMIDHKNDVFSLLKEMSNYYDEPFAATSMINTYVISRLAAKHAKVALSGEGADEVFAGYKWHKKIHKYYAEITSKERIKNLLKGNVSAKKVFMDLYNRSMTGVLDEAINLHLLNSNIVSDIRHRRLWHFEDFYFETNEKVKLSQYIDAHTFVPDHCLFRADISSMAHSLEVRVPFLDHEIYEYVFSLHPSVYFKPDKKKFLIEENLKNRMPKEVLEMPKRGFSFHNTDSIFDDRFQKLMRNGELMKRGVLQVNAEFSKLSTQMKFHLLNLEFWFQRYAN